MNDQGVGQSGRAVRDRWRGRRGRSGTDGYGPLLGLHGGGSSASVAIAVNGAGHAN